ncbi:hypothetical protein [Ruminococcus flavefaciens]|uniref:hypothetical protein n=1 Tax=Ruminococcus flavefaciens TaxID=1265 RepID=UPI000312345A|nr:hypothetical protein [Ruminococcus flavefaciens]
MKKAIIAIALGASVCSLAACGKTVDTDNIRTEETTKTVVTETTEENGTDGAVTTTKKAAGKDKTTSAVADDKAPAPESAAYIETDASLQADMSAYTDETAQGNPETEVDPVTGTAFKASRIENDVYTSPYAGISFRPYGSLKFKSFDDIHTQRGQALRMMAAEDRWQAMCFIDDGELINTDTATCVSFQFCNTKLRFAEMGDMSESSYINSYVMAYADLLGQTFSTPESVTLGGTTFQKVRVYGEDKNTPIHVIYVRKIDSDFILEISASLSAIGDEATFESHIETA